MVYNFPYSKTDNFVSRVTIGCRADFRKFFGKELETLNDSKDGHSPNGRWFVFDEFEIDASNRTCVRNGVEVPLTARVFDILLVFAENPGRLLEKDELIEKVWRGDFVEDGNLTRNVSTLRKALGDTGREHKYINTVQGHGYKFVADVGERKNGSRSAELPKAEAPTPVQEVRRSPSRHGFREIGSGQFLRCYCFRRSGSGRMGSFRRPRGSDRSPSSR